MARKNNSNVKKKTSQRTIALRQRKPKADGMALKGKAIMILESDPKLNGTQEDTNRKPPKEASSSQQQLLALPSKSAQVYYSHDNELATAQPRMVLNNKGKGRADPKIQESISHDLSICEPSLLIADSDIHQLIQANTSSHVQYTPSNMSRNQPSGGFFEGSTDKVEIKGGTINHTLGHHMNFSIQVNPPHEEQYDTTQQHSYPPLLSRPLSQTRNRDSVLPPTQDIQSTQSPPMATYESPTLTSTVIYSPDNSNKIYERHLELKRRGFPLWIPEPNRTLPMPYRRQGVNIGDVGIITPSGGFLFLFNICLPHDDPINPRKLPDGFVPIPIDSTTDIREDSEFKPESYLASTAIERTDNNPSFRGLSFSTSAEGAILTLPDGAISRDLVNIRRFRAYANANIESWYRYVNGTRGCEAKNGEIRLVTGCVKATSWGMAAVANMTKHKVHHLKYRSVEDVAATTAPIPLYKWEHTGFAEARVGPDLAEIEDLKRDDHSNAAVAGKYWNQCLFMHTLNISLSDNGFATIDRELESALIEESRQLQNRGGSNSTTSTPLNAAAQMGSSGQQQGTNSASQTRSTSESLGSVAETLDVGNVLPNRVIMTRSQSAPISHPADVLNKLLMEKVPNCRVVITQDEDWCSVIKEDDEIMPSPSEIAERVLAVHHVREEDGVVFLEPKEEQQCALRRQILSKQPIKDNTDSQCHTVGSPGLAVSASTSSASQITAFTRSLPSRIDSQNASALLDSYIDDMPYDVFNEYGAIYAALPRPTFLDANTQPQHIGRMSVDDRIHNTDTISTKLDQRQNQAENFGFETGVRAESGMSTQNSPTDEGIRSRQPIGTFGHSQNLSGIQLPVRAVIGSPATRQAAERRRKSKAIFICDYCVQSFTRKHNLLNHMQTHLGKGGTQCPEAECGRHLSKTSLSRHMRKFHGIRTKDRPYLRKGANIGNVGIVTPSGGLDNKHMDALHLPYQRKGVDIGDVGIITPSGGFLFMFNICLPHDDPNNPSMLPDGFVPIEPPTHPMDIYEYSEFQPKSYLVSQAPEKIETNPRFRALSLPASATEGTVLTLPDGAIPRNLEDVKRFRAYAAANIESWYRYVKGPRGYEAKNGDVRLVIGCNKAAAANTTSHKTHYLDYGHVNESGATLAPTHLYKRDYTRLSEARRGSDFAEIESLKRNDDSDVAIGGKYWNQCLFICTLNLILSDEVFASIELECALIPESPNKKGNHGQQQGMNSGNQTDSMIISRSPSVLKSHPADVLNKVLLKKVPNCRVVITQDGDWYSVISEEDEIMPSPSEIAERVLAAHHVREEDGVVFLEPKTERQSDLKRRQISSSQYSKSGMIYSFPCAEENERQWEAEHQDWLMYDDRKASTSGVTSLYQYQPIQSQLDRAS